LIPSKPAFVMFVEVPTSTFQSDTSFIEIEMFAVVFEEFEEEKTDISRGLNLGRLDSRVKLEDTIARRKESAQSLYST